ncbi:hypothetical protein F4802DRAFT_419944 [Xylaria palmicola]|nr:hypothetical protein F4802DRAFT_419944 [Xylaria palmicola]
MDAASTAFSKILHKSSSSEKSATPGEAGTRDSANRDSASVTKDTAPAVEHETVRKEHEERQQKVLERERHQEHYKTTVQPLKEREVMPEKHVQEQADVQHRHVNLDREGDVKAKHQGKQAQFKNISKEAGTHQQTVQEPTLTSEHSHHHLHETIQPVIEKETVVPSVTHKKIPIKETVQDQAIDEGVTINPPMSREEFESRMRK